MKAILTLLAVGSSVGLGWGVYRYSIQAAQENLPAATKPAVSVEVMVSNKRPMEDRARLVGSLTAGSMVQVLAPRNGYIVKLPFDVGDEVKRGEVLVELDDREQKELLAGAKAALVVAEAQKKTAMAQEQLALSELTRQIRLTERSATTQQALELAEAQHDIAVAQRELEEARVKQAESEVSRHQLTVDDSKILATQDGFIGERLKEVGDLAKPDVPLLSIVSFETVRTVVHVVEKDYPRVQVGQTATLHVDAFPETEFQGKVMRKAPILNPNTRTAAVQIEIPNEKGLLKPGMHADVSLVFERRNAVVLPIAALLDDADQPSVLVVENDPPTVRVQEVTTGINDGEFVEILSGISPDDHVVTMGNRMVKSGQTVDPVKVPWATPAETEIVQDGPPAKDAAPASAE
jgi:RND family efflux transporter MFP subunit